MVLYEMATRREKISSFIQSIDSVQTLIGVQSTHAGNEQGNDGDQWEGGANGNQNERDAWHVDDERF